MKLRKGSIELAHLAVAILALIAIAVLLYAPHREKVVFNKFRDPNQPPATYFDAVFSQLRITSK